MAQNFVKKLVQTDKVWKPIIFDFRKKSDCAEFKNLMKKGSIKRTIDRFENQEKEYFQVKNPHLRGVDFEKEFSKYRRNLDKPSWQRGRWIYFPWLFLGVHLLDDSKYQAVRTARNRNLISEKEQKLFYDSFIGIGGLSVGFSVALAIVLEGGGRNLRLADPDVIEISNLNRIPLGLEAVGLPKVVVAARKLYEINPYLKIEIFPEGLSSSNIRRFSRGLDLIIDELDDLAIKFLVRKEAKRLRLPILMAADNGDSGVVDIERYDLNRNTPFFHNRMGKVTYEKLLNLGKMEIGMMITKHVGYENIGERMQQSLSEIGKTIVSWPQLGGTALLNGASVAYCARKILNKQPIKNNRGIISLEEKLGKN